jgi:glycerate kinase
MKVVIAPDSFKGTITNFEVARAIAEGWSTVRPLDELTLLPMADGGEGTLETIAASQLDAVSVSLTVGNQISWLLLPDGTAIVELARICGITQLKDLDPMRSHTYLFGEALKSAALDSRVKQIVATVGGSASTDGGVGALIALGARFLNDKGELIQFGGIGLQDIASIDLVGMTLPPVGGVTCLVDVTNPLLGSTGSARIFSPQKGASADQVVQLEAGLAHFKKVTGQEDFAGAGAAGGAPFGLRLGWKVNIESGAMTIASLIGLPEAIAATDVVITGEGRLDSQSSFGKVAGTVRQIAEGQKKKVLYCVGSSEEDLGVDGIALVDIAPSITDAMTNPSKWLIQAAKELAQRIER